MKCDAKSWACGPDTFGTCPGSFWPYDMGLCCPVGSYNFVQITSLDQGRRACLSSSGLLLCETHRLTCVLANVSTLVKKKIKVQVGQALAYYSWLWSDQME